MALKKTIIHNIELIGDKSLVAYVRVRSIEGGKARMTAVFDYLKDDGNGDRIKTGSVDFVPNLDGVNFISQAYVEMKKLPALIDAQDC